MQTYKMDKVLKMNSFVPQNMHKKYIYGICHVFAGIYVVWDNYLVCEVETKEVKRISY